MGKTGFYQDHLLVSGGRWKTQGGVGAILNWLPKNPSLKLFNDPLEMGKEVLLLANSTFVLN